MIEAGLPGTVVRYLLGGAAGLAVGVGVTAAMREGLDLPVTWAFAAALAAVFSFHFVSSAYFVFRTKAGPATLARYTVSAAAFRGGDFVLFAVFVDWAGMYYPVAVVFAMSISNAIKFLVYWRYVFVTPSRPGRTIPDERRADGSAAPQQAPAADVPGGRR